jgi:hypothetical protein
LSDSIDEKYPKIENEYSPKLEAMLKVILEMYNDLLSLFNQPDRQAKLSPVFHHGKFPFEPDDFDETITLKVRSMQTVFSGKDNRNKFYGTGKDQFVTSILTEKQCSKTCIKLCCSVCGKFTSYEDIIQKVLEAETEKVSSAALKLKQTKQRIKVSDDEESIAPENLEDVVSNNKADWFFGGYFEDKFMSCDTRTLGGEYLTQFNIVHTGLVKAGLKGPLDIKTGDKFRSFFIEKMAAHLVVLKHHFDNLVVQNNNSHFDNKFSHKIGDNLSQYLANLNDSKFGFGDEFTLKALATFFEFEAYVLVVSSDGKEECVLHFNPFIEFGNKIQSVLRLVYFGGNRYKLGVKLPSRQSSVHIDENAKSWINSLKLDRTCFTDHELIEDEGDVTDNDTSFMSSYVADLSIDDVDLKEKLISSQQDLDHSRNSDIVRLGEEVYSDKPNVKSIRIMDTLFHDLNGKSPSGDLMLDLFNAINIAARGKMYISSLLETAVTALFFSESRKLLRDEVDWLEFISYIKLSQLARFRVEKGYSDTEGKKITFHALSRDINFEIAKCKTPLLQLSQYATAEAYHAAVEFDKNREASLSAALAKKEELTDLIAKKEKDYDLFKNRLDSIMWEICVELWKIWYSLSNLDEKDEKNFVSSSSEFVDLTAEDPEYLQNIKRYTNPALMSDFQALRTTYKAYYTSRRDLPKDAADAKVKHEQMKLKAENKAANKAENKLKRSTYYPALCNGDDKKTKKKSKKSVKNDDDDDEEGEDEDEGDSRLLRNASSEDEKQSKKKRRRDDDSISIDGTIEIIAESANTTKSSRRNGLQSSVKLYSSSLLSSNSDAEFTPVKAIDEDTQPQYSVYVRYNMFSHVFLVYFIFAAQ